MSHPDDLDPPCYLLRGDQLALARAGADAARFLPGLRRGHVAFPERPGPALPRPDRVNGAAGLARPEDAVAVGPLAQAAAQANLARVQPADLLGCLAAQLGDGVDLVVVDPDDPRRPGAAVAAAGTAEAQAVGVPRFGHGAILGLLAVPRLVQLHLETARHLEVRHQAVAVVRDVARELDAARFQLRDGLLDVVAVERDVVHAGRAAVLRVGGVAAQVGLGQVEDQPALADVARGEAQLVAEEGAQCLRLRRVEHGVYALDHGTLLDGLRAVPGGLHGNAPRRGVNMSISVIIPALNE